MKILLPQQNTIREKSHYNVDYLETRQSHRKVGRTQLVGHVLEGLEPHTGRLVLVEVDTVGGQSHTVLVAGVSLRDVSGVRVILQDPEGERVGSGQA